MIVSNRILSYLGFFILLGISLPVFTSARTSLYVLGLLPIIVVIILLVVAVRATKLKLRSMWLSTIVGVGFLIVATLCEVSAKRVARDLRDLRQNVLPMPGLQIGQPLPILADERGREILRAGELRLQVAGSWGLVSSAEPYRDAGVLNIVARDYTKANQFLSIAQRLDSRMPVTTNDLGVSYYYQGQKDQAKLEFQRASLEFDRTDGAPPTKDTEAIVYNNLGVALRDKGQLDEALTDFGLALEKSTSEEITLTTRLQVAAVYRIQGRYEEASKIADEVLAARHASDYPFGIAMKMKGLVAEDKKEFKKALEFYSQAAATFEKGAYLQDLALVFNDIGNVYVNDPVGRNPSMATEYYRKALKINQELGLETEQGLDHANLAYVYYEVGDTRRAMEEATVGLDIARRKGNSLEEAAVLDTIGLIHQKQGSTQLALSAFEDSLRIARRTGQRLGQAETLEHLASLHAGLGKYKMAKALALEAQAIYEQAGDDSSAGQIRKMYQPWELQIGRK